MTIICKNINMYCKNTNIATKLHDIKIQNFFEQLNKTQILKKISCERKMRLSIDNKRLY